MSVGSLSKNHAMFISLSIVAILSQCSLAFGVYRAWVAGSSETANVIFPLVFSVHLPASDNIQMPFVVTLRIACPSGMLTPWAWHKLRVCEMEILP